MSSYKLSFGTINILQNNLAEIVVDEGVRMNMVSVGEFHDFIINNLQAPVGLLINKKHSYSYTFKAQKTIIHLEQIKSTAVLAMTSGAVMSTETLININGDFYNNINMFQEREAALHWLGKELT